MVSGKNIKITESKPSAKADAGKAAATKSAPAVIRHPIADMERAFDRFFGRGFPAWWQSHEFPSVDALFGGSLAEIGGQRLPNLDVIDRSDEIVVRAEVPGVDKKDISISLTDNLLTIKGQSKTEKKEEDGDYHKREISSSAFARSFTLPGAVDAGNASASLKDGVLEISLPKSEASKKRNIEVK